MKAKTIMIMPLLPLVSVALTLAAAMPARAQEVTREQAQAVLSRVSQDVWHAHLASTGYGRVQEFYTQGERAYFKGDYAEAVKKLEMADKIVREMPNDYSGPAEAGASAPSVPRNVHVAP